MNDALTDHPLALERHTLGNGLRVVLHRDARLPLVAVNLWYHVGSKNERPGRTGLAHLFEHLLFEGSANVGSHEHFHYVQQAGGVANGSTWYDRTNYYETLPSHQLDLGLWLESDRMGFFLPAVTQGKLDTQREVVINERRQRIDNQPYGRATERLHELLYPQGHPYRWPVIGYIPDLQETGLEDVRGFFSSFYAPNNAVLTLAGDFDPDVALRRVEHYFGDIPAGPAVDRPSVPSVVPGQEGRRDHPAGRAVLDDQVALSRVYLGFVAPPLGADAWYAGDLWTTAMCSGKASPLYEDLVYRRQLAQDVGCYINPTESAATVTVVATAQPDVEVARLEAALAEHLERSATEPLAEHHLERARNQLLCEHYERFQELDHRADLLGQFTTYFDDPAAAARQHERYQQCSAEDLAAFVATYCPAAHRTAVTVRPRSSAPAPTEAAV